MKPKPYCEQIYGPMLAKTFPNVLTHWLGEEFPHLGGPKVRALFGTEVMRLIDAYHVPRERLLPGQTVWYAVDKTDPPSNGRTMAETRLVPVILTLVAREDIQRLFQGMSLPDLRGHIVARLHRETDAQGGVLAETDTGLLLNCHPSTIGSAIRAYEQVSSHAEAPSTIWDALSAINHSLPRRRSRRQNKRQTSLGKPPTVWPVQSATWWI